MNYNPDTHCVVPFPELPRHIAKGNLGVCYYDAMQMHQYAMRYANLVIAAAPQPQQSVEPVAWMHMKYGHIQKNEDGFPSHLYSSSEQWTPLFTAPPNVAEIQAKAIEKAAEEIWYDMTPKTSADAIRELAEKVRKGEVKL